MLVVVMVTINRQSVQLGEIQEPLKENLFKDYEAEEVRRRKAPPSREKS